MRAQGGKPPGSAHVPCVGDGVPPSRTSRRVESGTGVRSLHTPQEVRFGRMPKPTRWKRALPGTFAPRLLT